MSMQSQEVAKNVSDDFDEIIKENLELAWEFSGFTKREKTLERKWGYMQYTWVKIGVCGKCGESIMKHRLSEKTRCGCDLRNLKNESN